MCNKQHSDDNTTLHLPISRLMLPSPHSDQILLKFPSPHKKLNEPTLSYPSRIISFTTPTFMEKLFRHFNCLKYSSVASHYTLMY